MSSVRFQGLKTSFGTFDITLSDKPEPRAIIHAFNREPKAPTKAKAAGCGGCGDGIPYVVWPKLRWQGTPKPVRAWNWLIRKPKTRYEGCGCFIPLLKLNEWLTWKVYFIGFLTYGSGTPIMKIGR
jgi:hypothetical protein